MPSDRPPMRHPLVGRESERGEIERVLSAVREGLSGVLVLRGEAGIGKTALIDHAVASAAGLEVLRLVGVQSEMSLGFAGLQQLLSPLPPEVDDLPVPQREALRAALGLSLGVEPDRFLVGLATLTLLAGAATHRGLLIAVDDAQWLDQESVDAIAFVSRRLDADGVGIVWGVRDPSDPVLALDGLPTLAVVGLSEGDSGELLAESVGGTIDAKVRSRLLANARGNPLALVELSRELSRDQLSGMEFVAEPLPVGSQFEAHFLRQVRSLPAETQQLLLVASADPTGDLDLVWRAGVDLGFDAGAVAPAERADLIGLGARITFRHPLIREAIYSSAPDEERRRAHEALAVATDADCDPDRRAWHRASACVSRDEGAADELEDAAGRARGQGGYAATAAFLARSAELTSQRSRRAARFLGAAAADLTAGSTSRAYAHLALASPDIEDQYLRADARRLEGMISWIDIVGHGGAEALERHSVTAPGLLLEAGIAQCGIDTHAARDTFCDALTAAGYFGEWSSLSVHEIARTAKRAIEAAGAGSTSRDLAHDALAEMFANGHRSAEPLLRACLASTGIDPATRGDSQLATMKCLVAFALGDYDWLHELATQLLEVSREQNALMRLSPAYLFLGSYELAVGSLSRAEMYFAEQDNVLALRGVDEPHEVSHLVVLAWRGRETELRVAMSSFAEEAPRRGLGLSLMRARWALAVLELGLGNYGAAAVAIPHDGWQDDVAYSVFIASDAIEGHVRAGDLNAAQIFLDWLALRAEVNQTPLELGLLHRSAALLSETVDAEREFVAAIGLLERSGGAVHVGRGHLLYGEWLRRQRRRGDARRELQVAFEGLSSAGAEGFAERARLELLATGATARKRVEETRTDLTPQEARIAQLAASGKTNAEIGAALFISPYTVEYHLRKVFNKLNVKSRRQLSSALPS